MLKRLKQWHHCTLGRTLHQAVPFKAAQRLSFQTTSVTVHGNGSMNGLAGRRKTASFALRSLRSPVVVEARIATAPLELGRGSRSVVPLQPAGGALLPSARPSIRGRNASSKPRVPLTAYVTMLSTS